MIFDIFPQRKQVCWYLGILRETAISAALKKQRKQKENTKENKRIVKNLA